MSRKWIVLFVLLLAPAAASAQSTDASSPAPTRGRFELTPTVSYNFGGTLSAESSYFEYSDLETADAEAFGITFGIPLSPRAQIELLASRQQTRLENASGFFPGGPGAVDLDVSYYHVGGLFQWGSGQVHPFVVASLGVTTLVTDLPGSRDESKFSGSIGGGVKLFLTERIGLRVEARGFRTLVEGDDNGIDGCDHCDDYRDGIEYGYADTFDQMQASVGLIIAW